MRARLPRGLELESGGKYGEISDKDIDADIFDQGIKNLEIGCEDSISQQESAPESIVSVTTNSSKTAVRSQTSWVHEHFDLRKIGSDPQSGADLSM
jgi:hypothetical protein